jgi:hypothetical protein
VRQDGAGKIIVRPQAALPAPADDDEFGIERRCQQAPFGSRISMSDASAKSAARADREVSDMLRNLRQKRGERTTGNGCLEMSVARKRANAQLAAVLAHIIERIDAVDVDHAGGAGEPKIHRRHEALSASKDFSFLTVSGKQIERIVNRAGREIFERNRFHQHKQRVEITCYLR